MPEYFAKNGYHTLGVGKITHGYLGKSSGLPNQLVLRKSAPKLMFLIIFLGEDPNSLTH